MTDAHKLSHRYDFEVPLERLWREDYAGRGTGVFTPGLGKGVA